jgi:hypothetical protein
VEGRKDPNHRGVGSTLLDSVTDLVTDKWGLINPMTDGVGFAERNKIHQNLLARALAQVIVIVP